MDSIFGLGTSTIFFLSAIIAGAAYSLQQVLLVRHSRKIDPLTVAAYRNLSFIFTMFPILLLAGKGNFFTPLEYLHLLIPAAFCGAAAYWIVLKVQNILPVGIAMAFFQLNPVVMVLLGFFILHQTISPVALLFMGIIVSGSILLSLQKTDMPHLEVRTLGTIGLVILGVFFAAMTFFLMSIVAQKTNPFSTGYYWEVMIGLMFLLFGVCRKFFHKKKQGIPLLPRKKIVAIALAASPTVIGSSLLPFAMTLGSPGVAHSLNGATGILCGIAFSHFLFKEHLTKIHYFCICIVIAGVVGLRLSL